MLKKITSGSNPLIKKVKQLQKASKRKKAQLFIVEGLREVKLALEAGYQIEQLLFCSDFLPEDELKSFLKGTFPIADVGGDIFNELVYREDSKNVLAICQYKPVNLKHLKISQQPLILVLETVEKPGNLGAILRTCDAAGVDAVLVCDNQTDLFNPNVIRSSLGAIFTNQVVLCSSDEAIKWLQAHEVNILTSYLHGAENYYTSNLKQPIAIVMGSEAGGVSDVWIQNARKKVLIPMHGKVDSMNVSVSAAILLFEAVRQRQENGSS